MELNIDNIWKEKLHTQWQEPYFKEMIDFLSKEYQDETTEILPPKNQIFNALNACNFHDIKVVIIRRTRKWYGFFAKPRCKTFGKEFSQYF